MDLNLRVEGVQEIESLLGQLDRELKQDLKGRLRQASRIEAEGAKSRTRSRRIRAAITYDVDVVSLIDYRATIGPERKKAFFARFVEEGTKPHAIKNPFGWKGVTVFHPGARPSPFLEPTLEATEEQIVDLVGIPPVLR